MEANEIKQNFPQDFKDLPDNDLIGYFFGSRQGDLKNFRISAKKVADSLGIVSLGGTPIYFDGNQLPSLNNTDDPVKKGDWVNLAAGQTYLNINGGDDVETPIGRWSIGAFNGSSWTLKDMGALPTTPTNGVVKKGNINATPGGEVWLGDRKIARELTESINLINPIETIPGYVINRETGNLEAEAGSETTMPIPLNGITDVFLSGQNTGEGTVGFRFLDSNENKLMPAAVSGGTLGYNLANGRWATAPANAKYVQLTFKKGNTGDTSTLMLNKGKVKFDYLPYKEYLKGLLSVQESIRTKADASGIFIAGGANLINPNMRIFNDVRISSSTGLQIQESGSAMTELIPVKGNTPYMIDGRTDVPHLFRFLDEAGNPLQPLFNGEPAGYVFHNRNVRRSPENAKFAQIVFKQNNTGDLSTLFFYEGNVEKPYEKYIPVVNPSKLSNVTFNGGFTGTAKELDDKINANIDNIFSLQNLLNDSQNAISNLNSSVGQKVDKSEKGTPSGVATLNSFGKIPSSQIDFSGMKLMGNYNPTTNTPNLTDGVGEPNNYYIISEDGTRNFGSGAITFKKGDKVVYTSGGKWILDANKEAPSPISDTNLSSSSQFIRVSDILFNIYNENDKSYRQFVKVVNYKNGVTITDANIDNVIFKKIGNEYFAESRYIYYGDVTTKFYGIKSDGVTNDQPQFQKLINFLNLIGGGNIWLSEGRTRLLNKGLKWYSNISLIGKGILTSILQCDATKQDDFDLNGIYNVDMPVDGSVWTPIKNAHFRDFMIDCSGYHNKGVSSVGRKAMFILGMENCDIERVFAYRSIGTGFGCDHLTKTNITNCLAVECGSYIGDGTVLEVGQSGIGIGTGVLEDESVVIDGNWCIDNGNYGIFVESQGDRYSTHSFGAKVINNHCVGNRFGIGNRGSGATIISSNSCYRNKRHGIYIDRWAYGSIVTGNDCAYNLLSGIYIIPTDANGECDFISTNKLRYNGEYGLYLQVSANGTGAVASNNIVNHNGLSGILVSYYLRNIQLKHNTIFDNGTKGNLSNCYGIYIRSGHFNIAQGNIIYSTTGNQKSAIFVGKGLTNENLSVVKPTILKDNIATGYSPADAFTFESGALENVDYIMNGNISAS